MKKWKEFIVETVFNVVGLAIFILLPLWLAFIVHLIVGIVMSIFLLICVVIYVVGYFLRDRIDDDLANKIGNYLFVLYTTLLACIIIMLMFRQHTLMVALIFAIPMAIAYSFGIVTIIKEEM